MLMYVAKEPPNLHRLMLSRESIKGWLGNHTQSKSTHMPALKQSSRYLVHKKNNLVLKFF